jgi:RING finger protein 113A
LEQQWEEEQKKKKEQQEKEIQGFLDASNGNNNNGVDENNDALSTDDGIPYACYICRKHFNNPVVTSCNHYFCEPCIMQKIRSETESCPICGKDTHGVFNKPTKLLSKRRRVLGASAASKENAWEEFAKAFQKEE